MRKPFKISIMLKVANPNRTCERGYYLAALNRAIKSRNFIQMALEIYCFMFLA